MEYIEGVSVEEYVHEFGPLSIADACEVGRQAALGLEYIHQHAMVHRDIKPSNLMLALPSSEAGIASGEWSSLSGGGSGSGNRALVKVLDLGLALLAADEEERFTRFENRAMGTGMYMAPEQWRTTSVDIRADIYSLGCTLYHMLAGRPPFADSDLRPQRAHEMSKLPKISRADQPIPRQLWTVLRKMTAKPPEDRYASPLQVAMALEPFCSEQDLAALVERHQQAEAAATKLQSDSDTNVSHAVALDTQLGSRPRWQPPSDVVAPRRSRLPWRTVVMFLLVVAVGVASWMTASRPGVGPSSDRWEQNLILTANFAGDGIEDQIEDRIDVLVRSASESQLARRFHRLEDLAEDASDDEKTDARDSLDDWMLRHKLEHDAKVPSNSWFLTNAAGIQIARSPLSRSSMGGSYAHRDYFHGEGRDWEPESDAARNAQPLREPHQSAVYESTSTGMLKVAFSAPAWEQQEVIGVLGMSVDLYEFSVLEEKLLPGQQVVLLNLATDYLESPTGDRGLILHHPNPVEGEPRRAGLALLGLIDEAFAKAAAESRSEPVVLREYQDRSVTSGKPFRGAVRRVSDPDSVATPSATDWVVLVQEPIEE
jgi:serine/threonine protein kinase